MADSIQFAKLIAGGISFAIGLHLGGKTSGGQDLSENLRWSFYDGDDFHPQTNIDKMAQGIPMNNGDQHPWLVKLHQSMVEHPDPNRPLIVPSSALKTTYRRTLRGGRAEIMIYLKEQGENLKWKTKPISG